MEAGLCEYEDALFLQRALNIVSDFDQETDDPLFLFYSPHIVHEPLQVPKEWLEKMDTLTNDDEFDDRKRYLAMVQYMDSAIGNLTDAIQVNGNMWNNTLIVFSADNGTSILAMTLRTLGRFADVLCVFVSPHLPSSPTFPCPASRAHILGFCANHRTTRTIIAVC